jgi:hypothetical protein
VAAPVARIAMWSGPRNISTAMMRSFGSRTDTLAVDEPFYAAYLAATGLDHPMRAEIISEGESDPDVVARTLSTDPLPPGKHVHYQKHMTHHMLDVFPREWIDRVASAFLIRDPEAVLASYVRKRESVTLDDIGFRQQAEIFDRVADRLGAPPPVIEGADILTAPAAMLGKLCAALGIAFDPAMLAWAPGPRAEDGVWAPHWYGAVWASTGFAEPSSAQAAVFALPDSLRRIADAARPYYERVARYRLTAES